MGETVAVSSEEPRLEQISGQVRRAVFVVELVEELAAKIKGIWIQDVLVDLREDLKSTASFVPLSSPRRQLLEAISIYVEATRKEQLDLDQSPHGEEEREDGWPDPPF